MKRVIGFVLITFLGLNCSSAYAQRYLEMRPSADTSAYLYKMTGEELASLMLIETDSVLHIENTRITSEVPVLPIKSVFLNEIKKFGMRWDGIVGGQKVGIKRPIVFSNCLFEKDFLSGSTIYDSSFFCLLCYFSGDAEFTFSTFCRGPTFICSVFHSRADFEWCTVSNYKTEFSGCTFSDSANFNYCDFSHAVYFIKCVFFDRADFSSSTFSDIASFWESTFLHNVNFMGSNFSGTTAFDNARFYCVVPIIIDPMPGRVNLTNTKWANELHLENIITRPGVVLDFTGAKWDSVPKTLNGESMPVLFLENADYNKLLFPVTGEKIPEPLLGFGSSDRAFLKSGWQVQISDPDETEWPVIQRTYGKFLTFLKESGRYDDHDALFTEFHNLETYYKWYKGNYLSSAFNFLMGLICGYGVKPFQTLRISGLIVLLFAGLHLIVRIVTKDFRFPKWNQPKRIQGSRFLPLHLFSKNGELRKRTWSLIALHILQIAKWIGLFLWYLISSLILSLATFFNLRRGNNHLRQGASYAFMFERILGPIMITLFIISMMNILIR